MPEKDMMGSVKEVVKSFGLSQVLARWRKRQ